MRSHFSLVCNIKRTINKDELLMFLVLMKGWRNEGKKAFYCLYVLLFFTFSFIGVQKIIAEEVEFTGTTAPLNEMLE